MKPKLSDAKASTVLPTHVSEIDGLRVQAGVLKWNAARVAVAEAQREADRLGGEIRALMDKTATQYKFDPQVDVVHFDDWRIERKGAGE